MWGVLEQHWNGALPDSVETVEKYIESMIWKGNPAFVKTESRTYNNGVKVGKKDMRQYEEGLERKKGIEKWFVKIDPQKNKKAQEAEQKE